MGANTYGSQYEQGYDDELSEFPPARENMTPSTVLAIKYLQMLPNTTTLTTNHVDELVGGRDKPTA